MLPNWPRFWCCLPLDVRNFLFSITLESLIYCGGVSQSTFDTLFSLLNFHSDKYKEWLILTFLLTPGFCLLGDGTDVPVYYFDASLWGEFAIFQTTGDFACDDPCKYTTGVFALPS
jgi:hypothetical protein